MKETRLAWKLILLTAPLIYAGQGRADTWQHAVATRVSAEYETNPTMSPTNSTAVWRALFEPGYTLTKSDGNNVITTGLALQLSRASNKTLSPDRDSPSVFLNWLRPSEAGQFGISSRYAEIATRDSGGVDANGRVPVASTRASRTLSGNWSEELSERSTLAVDAGYEGVAYSGGGTYTDYSMRSGALRFGYAWDEQIDYFFRVSGNKYIPVGGAPSSSLVDATLGINWRNDEMGWGMQIGKSRVGEGRSDTQGSVSANYTGQRSNLTMNAGRSISPSGLGGFLKTDQLRGSWSYALTEYTNTGIDLARNKNMASVTTSESTGTTSGFWLDYNLTTLWRMRTSCQHRTVQGVLTGNASSNMIGLSFSYANSDF